MMNQVFPLSVSFFSRAGLSVGGRGCEIPLHYLSCLCGAQASPSVPAHLTALHSLHY